MCCSRLWSGHKLRLYSQLSHRVPYTTFFLWVRPHYVYRSREMSVALKNLLYRQDDESNEPTKEGPLLCGHLWVPIHLRFNSQQVPPLSSLSGRTLAYLWDSASSRLIEKLTSVPDLVLLYCTVTASSLSLLQRMSSGLHFPCSVLTDIRND